LPAILLIDNFDSFTWNIYHYLLMCGAECRLMRNDEDVSGAIDAAPPDGIVFSPGPMRPEQHPLMFEILQRFYDSKPILGICLGHQAIGEFFGAALVKAPEPVHGKVSEIMHAPHDMYRDIPDYFSVARYHSLILSGLEKTDLSITASTQNGLPMSIAHNSYPLWGVQYHPEAIQTEYGLQLLKNWASLFS
jgi:anthranilate synthase/aminodeoxychorismate synthase-like glutamine amidotransferase